MTALDNELLWAALDSGALVFLPKKLTLSMLNARCQLAHCRTWRDAHERLDAEWFATVADQYGGDYEDALDEYIAEEWPAVQYSSMTEWLPPDVVAEFGEAYSGLFEDGVTFLQERLDDIEEALALQGFRCNWDDRIVELFDLSP